MLDGRLALIRPELPDVTLNTHLAFQGDEFKVTRGSTPNIHHVDCDQWIETRPNEDLMIACYATAHYPTNPVPESVVIYKAELLTMKKKNKGPWSTHPLEMYKVRTLSRLVKRLPIGTGLLAKLGQFDDIDDFSEEPAEEETKPVVIDMGAAQETKTKAQPKTQTKAKTKAAPKTEPPKEEPVQEEITGATEEEEGQEEVVETDQTQGKARKLLF